MPIYEYQCRQCGHRLEAMQRLSEAPLTECPECAGELKKLISAPSFQFKGSGWYATDYAAKKGDAKRDAEGKSESKSGDGGSTSSGADNSQPASGGKEPSKKAAS